VHFKEGIFGKEFEPSVGEVNDTAMNFGRFLVLGKTFCR